MPDQKLNNLLNLALDATEEEREKSRNLNVGYEKQTRKWEIIVKYSEVGTANEEGSNGVEYGLLRRCLGDPKSPWSLSLAGMPL